MTTVRSRWIRPSDHHPDDPTVVDSHQRRLLPSPPRCPADHATGEHLIEDQRRGAGRNDPPCTQPAMRRSATAATRPASSRPPDARRIPTRPIWPVLEPCWIVIHSGADLTTLRVKGQTRAMTAHVWSCQPWPVQEVPVSGIDDARHGKRPAGASSAPILVRKLSMRPNEMVPLQIDLAIGSWTGPVVGRPQLTKASGERLIEGAATLIG